MNKSDNRLSWCARGVMRDTCEELLMMSGKTPTEASNLAEDYMKRIEKMSPEEQWEAGDTMIHLLRVCFQMYRDSGNLEDARAFSRSWVRDSITPGGKL